MHARLAPVIAAIGLAGLSGMTLGGCFTPADDGACRRDRDCGDAVCSNVGECASVTYELRIGWTLHGATANQPGACDRVAELELIVSDPSTGEEFAFRPVPCGIGSYFLDKMPPAYSAVVLTAYGAGGDPLTSAAGSTDPAVGVVNLDLRP